MLKGHRVPTGGGLHREESTALGLDARHIALHAIPSLLAPASGKEAGLVRKARRLGHVDIDDLESISTFGFRGEALPSIASVSRFEINTRQQDSIEGTKVICEGGTIKALEATGCPPGTSISVRNLFFNVPARKKFLRSNATEEAHIQETALLLALSRLDIFMELRFDNRLIFSVPATDDIRTRAALLFGRDMVKDMLAVNYPEAGIMITGLIARPEMTRNTRKEQRLFVNGRPIQAPPLYNGIKEAYQGLVVKGRFAPCLLYYVMNPSRVDINVHPAKREVRFKENIFLAKITAAAVSLALRGIADSTTQVNAPAFMDSPSHDSDGNTTDISPQEEFSTPQMITPVADISRVSRPTFTMPTPSATVTQTTSNSSSSLDEAEDINTDIEPLQPIPEIVPQSNAKQFEDLLIIGQYRHHYILAQNNSGLILISIRAANERILFEKMQAQLHNSDIESQLLLLPVTVDLSPADTRLVNKYSDQIISIGFEIEPFGGNTFVISAVPAAFPHENITGTFLDIIDQLRDNPRGLKRHSENFLLQIVSRSATRGNRKPLANEEIKYLIKELSQAQMPYSCPAGRPVLIHLSENELLRRFGRKE
ncbi:MAG: hypothetical protein HRT88_08485 [Lentisphaeraceae bacterium]|nr:hypothetical protein [Lentisphaeraceae bacterium]